MTGRRDISTPSSSRASQLEARIREIEAELDNVHDDMQLLRRVVDKPERSDIYPQYRARVAQAPGASEPSPAIARQEEPAAPADRRPLVAVRRPLSKGRDAAAAIPRTDQTGVPPAAGEQAKPELMTRDPRDHERFASYFTTGSLQALRPLRRERRTQRNRTIVALIFFVVVLVSVLQLVFRVWR